MRLSAPGATKRRQSPTSRKRVAGFASATLVVLLMVVAISGLWLANRATEIEKSLQASLDLVPLLQQDIASGNQTAATAHFLAIQSHIDKAHRAATDPLWRAAGSVPILGANFSAVTEIALTANDVVDRAIGPLLSDFKYLEWENLTPSDGRIDVDRIQQLSPRLSSAAHTVALSHERLSAIDESTVITQISRPLTQATEALNAMREGLTGAAAAADLLPGMLGADGDRSHLLLVQNNSEVRATGGIPGALAVISAKEGHISLDSQATASGVGAMDEPVIVDAQQVNIYSTRMGKFMQSVNLTPDFPTAAQTAALMWETYDTSSIDGVIALDPIALSYILEATGPVQLSFDDPEARDVLTASGLPTSLTAENVVPTLLSEVYLVIDEPGAQDAYFAAVATEIFDELLSGSAESGALVNSLIRSVNEGRLYLWSAHPNEQKIIAVTGLAGGVTGPISGGATFGAYFNDGTGAKMDYYVRRTVELRRSCTPEGYLQYTLTSKLRNTAPADAAEALPPYVTGGGVFGVPPGTVQTNFIGYGPSKSQLQTARIDGESVPFGSHLHGDRPLGMLTTRMAPGESVTVELDFTNVVQQSAPSLDVTPTIQPVSEVVLPFRGDTTCE